MPDAVFCCGFMFCELSGDTSNFIVCCLYKHISSFRLACFIPFHCPHKGKTENCFKLANCPPSVDIVAIRRLAIIPHISSERTLVAAANFITTFYKRDRHVGHESRLEHTRAFPLVKNSRPDSIAFTHGHC